MLLAEFEGKALLRSAGVAVPHGILARNPAQAAKGRIALPVAVKAQVGGGGRGKAGGVVRAATREQLVAAAERMFATEFSGERPRAILIEPWLAIERELYLAVTVDGRAGGYVVLYSPTGGIDVETDTPPLRYEVGPASNFRGDRLREVLRPVEADVALRERVIGLARTLLRIAASHDCTTLEINPLARLADGSLVAADAKVVCDDSAAFRSSDIAAAVEAERRRQPPPVAHALANKLMLVWLDGDVGIISSGAGMTMVTMDLIAAAGGQPACFLDCSANPTPDGYRVAFNLLDRNPKVTVILVTMFGDGVHIDRVARVMKEIMQKRRSKKPVVFRLNGTNAAKVAEVWAGTGLYNHATLETAAGQAVALAQAAPS